MREKNVLRSATPGPAGQDAYLATAARPGLMLGAIGAAAFVFCLSMNVRILPEVFLTYVAPFLRNLMHLLEPARLRPRQEKHLERTMITRILSELSS